MTVKVIAHVQTPGDLTLSEMHTAAEGIESRIESHFEALDGLDRAVRDDDLTGKKAEEARRELSNTFLNDTFAALDAVEAKHAALTHYCAKLANPPDPLAEALQRSNELVDVNVKLILQKCAPDEKGCFSAASSEGTVILSNWLLNNQLQVLNSTMRQEQVRNKVLNTKAGIITEATQGGGFSGRKVNQYEMRLHQYRQALAVDDADALAVFEDPADEGTFFYDVTDKTRKVWAGFMRLKSEALVARQDPQLKRDKSAAEALMDDGNRISYLTANKISKMLTNGKLTLSNDDQFERISRLLGGNVKIGGHNFGHSSFNSFAVRKAMKAKAGGN
jgi:hypothetical protein